MMVLVVQRRLKVVKSAIDLRCAYRGCMIQVGCMPKWLPDRRGNVEKKSVYEGIENFDILHSLLFT